MNKTIHNQLLLPGLTKPRFLLASALGCLSVVFALFGPSRASAQINQISQLGWVNITSATGNAYMMFPRATGFSIDNSGTTVQKVLLNWQTNDDSSQFPMTHGYKGSADAGATWASPSEQTTMNPDLDLMSSIRLKNGTVLAIPFYWGGTGTSFNFTYNTSTNNGVSWTNHVNGGTINAGSGNTITTFHFHRGIIEEANGYLYAPAYLKFSTDPTHRTVLFKSTDSGVTWNFLSNMAVNSSLEYTESCVVRCKNGDFYVVERNATGSTYNDLKFQRSTDKGLTWTSMNYLSGLPQPNQGVDPHLWMMPNGILVLSYGVNVAGGGKRNIHMAFCADGNGTTWSNDTVTFTRIAGSSESSGYTAVVPVSAHRFLQFSDTGTNASYASAHPSPNPYKIRSKIVDIVLAQSNRIDLKTRYNLGLVTITTDMTYTNAANPEARTTGAFDGSVGYWSGAFKSATSGSYTIDLQQAYTLNAIGVCLQYNTSESATIDYSIDGSSWTTVKTYTNAVHQAIDYTTPGGLFAARYVRVSATSAASPVSLNEIELYSNGNTFENNAVGTVGIPHGPIPPDYAANGTSATQYGFAVRDATTSEPGYQSTRSFQMWDGSSTWRAGIKKTVTATTSKTFRFWVKPQAYDATSGAITFDLLSGATNVYHSAVFPDGSIKYYNGSTWLATTGTGSPAGAGTVPLNTWSLIQVVATISPATTTITVNGAAKGTTGKWGTATTMDGFTFGSGGTAPVGDKALFDDVSIN